MNVLIWGKLGSRIYRRAHTRAGVRSVAYEKFIPSNPQTAKQQNWRRSFCLGMKEWKALSFLEKRNYQEKVKGLPLYPRNLFLSAFLKAKKNQAELFLSAKWQLELEKMASRMARARRLELARLKIPENFANPS